MMIANKCLQTQLIYILIFIYGEHMNTNLLAVHSIDIFNAATNIKAKKFTHAIVNKEKLISEFERMYQNLIDDIEDNDVRQDILQQTNGDWKKTVFPLEVLTQTSNYARVVLGGLSFRGYMFDITAKDLNKMQMKNQALRKRM
jgi:hypothetical protein